MNTTQLIAQGWASYAEANGFKPNTKKYYAMQHAYVMGVACVQAPLPAPVIVYLMSGRDIAELAQEPVAT